MRAERKRQLTPSEIAIANLVARGWSNKEVAEELGVTVGYVKNANRNIFDKIGVWNRTELAVWWNENYRPPAKRPSEDRPVESMVSPADPTIVT